MEGFFLKEGGRGSEREKGEKRIPFPPLCTPSRKCGAEEVILMLSFIVRERQGEERHVTFSPFWEREPRIFPRGGRGGF